MSRKKPVSEEVNPIPEGSAPEVSADSDEALEAAPEKPKRPRKVETDFQKVTRRLARAKRYYEKLEDSDDPESEAYKLKAKAKNHLDGCVQRYAKVANPPLPETEVEAPAEEQPA